MLELNKLYNLDCMEGMKQFPDKYFELAIVDPPYGININMNIGLKKGQAKKRLQKNWDKEAPNAEYFKELVRVSQNQIIWGGITFHFHQQDVFWYGIREKRCIIEVFPKLRWLGLLLVTAQEFIK